MADSRYGGYRNDSRRGSGFSSEPDRYRDRRDGGEEREYYDRQQNDSIYDGYESYGGQRSGGQRSSRYYDDRRAGRYEEDERYAGSYSDRQNDYADRQSAYADRQGAYADRQSAYADRQGAYSDRQSAYADRQGAYADRQGAYSDRQSAYADRQGAYADRQSAYADRQSAYADRRSSVPTFDESRYEPTESRYRTAQPEDDELEEFGNLPRVTSKSERRAEYQDTPVGGYARDERAAARQGGARYAKKSFIDDLADKFTFLGETHEKRRTSLFLVGGALLALIALLAVALCITNCDRSPKAPQGVPTIEQGDEEYDYTVTGGEEISGGDGSIFIQEEAGAVDSFTVEVSGMNGNYGRTGVSANDGGTLTISDQDENGFSFELTVGGTLSGYAYFNSATTAMYELEGGLINFSFENGAVRVYHTVQVEAFGGKSADGTYVSSPVTIEQQSAASTYDANVRKSDAVQSALLAALSSEDHQLMESIFKSGTCPNFQSAELTRDKNGNECTVDSEMQAVKYYAFVPGTGEELVLICRENGQFYIGLCDGVSYRYYTNDDSRKSSAPSAISGQAATKSMTLQFK